MVKKSKQLAKIKDPDCLNCGFPFSGYEIFCPECGQKNKGSNLTFLSFIKEIFNGFISWDAKFWKTIIPLLINPGKVSKDYIEGKRNRYSNPFRFYLTVSVIFFLILGITSSINRFKNLQAQTPTELEETNVKLPKNEIKEQMTLVGLDSLQNHLYKQIELAESRKDSLKTSKKTDTISTENKDVINNVSENSTLGLSIGDSGKIGKFLVFSKKNKYLSTDDALDSLGVEKTFSNRFWYSRAEFFNKIITDHETIENFYKQMLSYASVALFILLPLFTLFLKIIYARRKFTYIEHLVFVFHIQTFFFLLFSVFYLIAFFRNVEYIPLFLFLFLLYLFIAMKRFYKQGFFKTGIKFLLANFAYLVLGSFGAITIAFISFAIY